MQHLYISFHGGSASGSYNNLHVYDLDGTKVGKALDKSTVPQWVPMDELRGFTVGPDDKLYVANANKDHSNILRFASTGPTKWGFDCVFVQGTTPQNPGLLHPYDVVFGPDGDLYVTSQDTGLVSRFAGPSSPCPGTPLPSLVPDFPSGTFVSLQPGPFKIGTYPIRGIAFGPDGNLYVADEDDNYILVFDPQGAPCDPIESTADAAIVTPVQVQFNNGTLYIGSSGSNAVLAAADGALSTLVGPNGDGLDAVSGIGFDAGGWMYVGSRKANSVLSYDIPASEPTTVLSKLRDNPEFVKVITSP